MAVHVLLKKRRVILILLCVFAVIGAGYLTLGVQKYPELTELAQVNWTFAEYSDYFVKVAEQKGAPYAFEVLKYAKIPTGIDIHRVGHAIGYVLYDQQGLKGIQVCTDDFQNACQHALVVRALTENGSTAYREVAETCANSSGGRMAYITCFHGVGHGLLAYVGYDYEKALGKCKEVYAFASAYRPEVATKDLWYECVGGVTMEMGMGEHDRVAWGKAAEKYFPENDIYMPCDADFMEEETRPMCYTYNLWRLFEASGAVRGHASPEAYPRALAYCEGIPGGGDNRLACYQSMGARFPFFANGDLRTMNAIPTPLLKTLHEWCGFAPTRDGRIACTAGVAYTTFLSGITGGNTDTRAVREFCTLAPDRELEGNCYGMAVGLAKQYLEEKETYLSFCSLIPEPYKKSCADKEADRHMTAS